MAKTLRQFKELYTPKAADEKKFVDKHVVKKNKDQNGNDDKLFKATNVKPVKRATDHGYETAGEHDDEKVYEETQVDEKMNLKTASMGDVVKDFQKSKAPQFAGKSKEKRREMAVAAKLQAEEIEQVDELSKDTLKSYSSKNTTQRYHLAVDKLRNTRADGTLLSKKSDPEWLPGGKKSSLLNKRLDGAEKATAKIKQMGEDVEQVEEAEKVARHRPGWMLRSDKKLGDAAKQAKKMSQLMAKHGGKPEAGKSVKEEVEQIDELSAETRKSYLLKAAPMNRANPTKKRSMGINRALFAKSATPQTEEAKSVVDKSGAVHTPASRARHLAKMALKKQVERHAKEAAAEVVKKNANEEIDYEDIKQYLLSVYEGKLDQEEQQILNEMLETEEGAKLAFVITYFSGE